MSTESVARVRLEVVPSPDLAARLPLIYKAPGALSVTCLPHHGPSRTVAASVELAGLGYQAVPHLAARSIASQAELHSFLEQLQNAGITELFLVAGDRRTPSGPYSWSGQLIQDVKAFAPDISVGIAGYPEGHPQLSEQLLRNSLDSKAASASSLVTQMCFSAEAISQYLEKLRRTGVQLPVWVGVPGPITTKRLLAMGARLGVGRSLKLARGTGMARALWRRRDFMDFDSNRLMSDIHARLARDPLFAGFHVYTFNDLGRLPGLLNGLAALEPPAWPADSAASPLHPAKT
jgi:methylenetetrahydrofolate reductase (NADPH)